MKDKIKKIRRMLKEKKVDGVCIGFELSDLDNMNTDNEIADHIADAQDSAAVHTDDPILDSEAIESIECSLNDIEERCSQLQQTPPNSSSEAE